jgi:hypothetical protein
VNLLLKKVKITVTATIAVWRLLSTGPSVAVDAMIEVQGVTLERYFKFQKELQNLILATNPPSLSDQESRERL